MAETIRLAVVPVAGLGTRMLPLTRSIPKEMLPLGQKLCIEHIVDELLECGIEEIIFVVSHGKEKIAELFQQDATLDQRLRGIGKDEIANQLQTDAIGNRAKIVMVYQEAQKGLGDAILSAAEAVDGRPFVVALGDSLIHTTSGTRVLQRMCDAFHEGDARIIVAFQEVPLERVTKYGIALPADPNPQPKPGEIFELRGLVEKPDMDQAPSRLAISARYVLGPDIFAELEKTGRGTGGEIQLTDAMTRRIEDGVPAKGICLSAGERRIDIGSIPGYLSAFVEMAMADTEYGNEIRSELAKKFATPGD